MLMFSRGQLRNVPRFLHIVRALVGPGAHHLERATVPYSGHGVFIDRSIFRLNLPRIQTPTGTSVTNHKHVVISPEDKKQKPSFFPLPMRAHVVRNYFAGKES